MRTSRPAAAPGYWWRIQLFVMAIGVVMLVASVMRAQPSTRPATRPASTAPATGPSKFGPEVVMLKELMNLYEPVPFDHKGHAQMAEMWEGCVTCHHNPPNPNAATQPSAHPTANGHKGPHTQAESAQIPACKECHPVDAAKADIRMPSLKGAYHRQCLNCHREWSGDNNCVMCHKQRDPSKPPGPAPTRDDIIGRMHPPVPTPAIKQYVARFTPADGAHVLFRHDEHVKSYGLKCVQCHRNDNCSHCHTADKTHKPEARILKPAETWKGSHGPCISCHTESRCRSCHYKDDMPAPPPFDHRVTGQILDADHNRLTCNQCHTTLRSRNQLTCGGSACHQRGDVVAYPLLRPGPTAATRPASRPTSQPIGPFKGVNR